MEIRDLGISTIMIIMDWGFYSRQNILDLKKYSIIGAIPSTLKIYADLLSRSRGIENSRNYVQHAEETVFHMGHSIWIHPYMVYFSARIRAEKIQALYSQVSDMERDLHELQDGEFDNQQDMIRTVMSAAGRMERYVEIKPSGKHSPTG